MIIAPHTRGKSSQKQYAEVLLRWTNVNKKMSSQIHATRSFKEFEQPKLWKITIADLHIPRKSTGEIQMAKLEVLYNDECPICRREITHYSRLSDNSVEFVKITEATVLEWGLTEDQAAQQIHVRSDGELTAGVDAFISVWEKLPYYRWLALLVSWRPIRFVTGITYRCILAPLLFTMHRRRRKRQIR